MSEFDVTAGVDSAEQQGLRADAVYDVAIVGAGPGGLTAAIYAGRAKLSTIVLEKLSVGGLITVSDWVDNFPGFPEGISGEELGERFRKQAERFIGQISLNAVTSIRKENGRFYLGTERGEVKAKSVVLSTGSEPVKLPVPEEEKFRGKGLSYCATCDAAFFRNKVVSVVGGGDAALHEALYLTKFARRVFLVHRRGELRAARMLQEEVFANPGIELKLNAIPVNVLGDRKVEELVIENVQTHQQESLYVDGIFGAIGEKPNSELVKDLVELTDKGLIKIDVNRETSLKGLFAVGDVTDTPLKQVVTACADGAIAVISAEQYIRSLET
ncbi:MAG TPA: thioredoxin-disulfide reductase [Candidatus Deferrimicrobium sp.]|nr:thioredoxin-disulfide reductase [Candidatus Deferrimicrobium sp.]